MEDIEGQNEVDIIIQESTERLTSSTSRVPYISLFS